MHSSTFHFPFLPLFYQITGLSGSDVLSICNPIFQLKAEFTYLQLSSKPVTDADINFDWEVVSGAEPLEFVNTNTSTPTVIADPAIVIDTVFRVYIDRGTEDEWSAEMTVFRTPTENASNSLISDTTNVFRTSLAVNGQSFDNKFLNNLISPRNVTTIPSILSTFNSGSEVILSTENTTFTVVIDYPKDFNRLGHKIEGISAYNPNTGDLIASTNFRSDLIEIPITVTTFYLTFDVSLNYFNSLIPTKRVFISDNKVRSSYLRQWNQDNKQLNLYVTEGLTPKTIKELVNSVTYNKSIDVSLPQSLLFSEDAAITSKGLTNSITYNKQIQEFKPFSKIAPDELAALVNKGLTRTFPNNYVVTRFNGISIGG